MSILYPKKRYLFEAEDDENVGGETEQQDNTEDSGSDDNTNDDVSQEEDISDEEDEGQDDDFDIDADMDEEGEEDDAFGDDDNGSDTDSSSSSSSSDEEPPMEPDSLKAQDRELFDSLSPTEQMIKTKELKEQFIQLYTACDNTITKFNDLSMEYDDANEQISNILAALFSTKKMIADYVTHKFDSCSLIENDIMFNKYLHVLNSIKSISTDIKNLYKDDNSES